MDGIYTYLFHSDKSLVFWFFIVFMASSLIAMKLTSRIPIRRVPGLDAIEEAVGRATDGQHSLIHYTL